VAADALREFVLKVHQLCNLACDYCYVYTLADQSWRARPKIMSRHVWSAAARRIGEHAERHGLTEVSVVLHGGEPLLAGADQLAAIATTVRDALPPATTARITMQTTPYCSTSGPCGSYVTRGSGWASAWTARRRTTTGTAATPTGGAATRRSGGSGSADRAEVPAAVHRLSVHHRPSHRPGRRVRGTARIRPAGR